jgi:predicted ATPase
MSSNDKIKLKKILVGGYKSIHPDGQQIDFGDVTVLLGANGSGKSNLVSFFNMLNHITNKGLQTFIGKQGSADALLYYGAKITEIIEFTITLEQGAEEQDHSLSYTVKLVHGMPDRLFFAGEKVTNQSAGIAQEFIIDSGNGEAGLPDATDSISKVLFRALSGIRAYHFHDTSDTAKIKMNGFIDDSRYLRSDAGNLAAFLLALKNDSDQKRYYERITRHIRKVMPQFNEFDLEPLPANVKYTCLNWYDNRSEYLFGAHQISDGSLRFMALAALLLQPPTMLPTVVVLDEPELGLHPAAIAELAACRTCRVGQIATRLGNIC